MGALTVTSVSTFTSCKDYDSDISNLQGQIDKAALKTEVEAMKTTVEAAKTAAESAKTTAEKNATDLTDVKAKAEKLATQVAEALQTGKDAKAAADEAKDQCDELELKFFEYYTAEEVDKALDKLEAKIDANTESIEDLKAEVESYSSNINKLYSAVTNISLLIGGGDSNIANPFGTDLTFEAGKIASTYVFGKEEADDCTPANKYSADQTKTYTKDATFADTKTLLVRVSPVNANITADMIKLIDSKGGDLSKTLKVSKVERYNEYITKASSTESGLWKISLDLQDGVDKDAIEKKDGDKHICYAVAVNNTASATAEDAEKRYVISEYGVTLKAPADYKPTNTMQNVEVCAASTGVWKNLSGVAPSNNSKDKIYAQNGESIVVRFTDLGTGNADEIAKNTKQDNLTKVDRFYVVRDDGHAGESDASEINAWNKYSYEGLNKMVAVENGVGKDTIRVTIPADAKEGDEIQFRIFAVNYDGTLVKHRANASAATGIAFRVYVGAKTTESTVYSSITATAKNEFKTDWVELSKSLVKDGGILSKYADKYIMLKQNNNDLLVAKIQFADKNKTVLTSTGKDEDIVYAQLTIENEKKYKTTDNGVTYTEDTQNGTFTNALNKWEEGTTVLADLKDSNTPVVNNLGIVLTKILPTAEDAAKLAGISWKTNQLESDGSYIAYLAPVRHQNDNTSNQKAESWTKYSTTTDLGWGRFDMAQAINGFKAGAPVEINVADAAANTDDESKFTANLSVKESKGKWYMEVPAWADKDDTKLIDNKTPHEATIVYNFGAIKYNSADNYTVALDSRNYIFSCYLDENVQTYDWTQGIKTQKTVTDAAVMTDVNVLTYGVTETVKVFGSETGGSAAAAELFKYIKGTNKKDPATFGKTLNDLLSSKYVTKNSSAYDLVTVKLYTEGKTIEEYFNASVDTNGVLKFKVASNSSNPNADVKSTLHIELKDAFGHTHKYDLPFTVKRNTSMN